DLHSFPTRRSSDLLVVNARGGGGKTFRVFFKAATVLETESIRGFPTWLICASFFAAVGLVFFGKGFTVDGCFFATAVLVGGVPAGLGAFATTGGGLIHSRKVISSNAKSFPQPPGALSIMINLKAVIEAGVVKMARCCVTHGVSILGRSTVANCAIFSPSSVSRRMVSCGKSG